MYTSNTDRIAHSFAGQVSVCVWCLRVWIMRLHSLGIRAASELQTSQRHQALLLLLRFGARRRRGRWRRARLAGDGGQSVGGRGAFGKEPIELLAGQTLFGAVLFVGLRARIRTNKDVSELFHTHTAKRIIVHIQTIYMLHVNIQPSHCSLTSLSSHAAISSNSESLGFSWSGTQRKKKQTNKIKNNNSIYTDTELSNIARGNERVPRVINTSNGGEIIINPDTESCLYCTRTTSNLPPPSWVCWSPRTPPVRATHWYCSRHSRPSAAQPVALRRPEVPHRRCCFSTGRACRIRPHRRERWAGCCANRVLFAWKWTRMSNVLTMYVADLPSPTSCSDSELALLLPLASSSLKSISEFDDRSPAADWWWSECFVQFGVHLVYFKERCKNVEYIEHIRNNSNE